MFTKTNFKDRLKKLVSAHRTQSEFADLVGVSSGLLSEWLRDNSKKIPSIESVAKIHEATGADINWLLFGDGAEPGQHKQDDSGLAAIYKDQLEDAQNKLIEQARKAERDKHKLLTIVRECANGLIKSLRKERMQIDHGEFMDFLIDHVRLNYVESGRDLADVDPYHSQSNDQNSDTFRLHKSA